MTTDDTHILIHAAKAASLDLRTYSGRGMYGRKCVAIDSEHTEARVVCELIRAARDLTRDESALNALLEALEETRCESMGLGQVYYWPDVAAPADAGEGEVRS